MSFVKNAAASMGGLKSFVKNPSLSGFAKLSVGPIAFGDGPPNRSASAAILTQEQQDAAATAKAQTDAAVEANSLRVAQKRAYQANALALGGFADDSLGQPGGGAAAGAGSVLARGASTATRAAAASTTSGYTGGTALGAGASGGGGSGGGGRSTSMLR